MLCIFGYTARFPVFSELEKWVVYRVMFHHPSHCNFTVHLQTSLQAYGCILVAMLEYEVEIEGS